MPRIRIRGVRMFSSRDRRPKSPKAMSMVLPFLGVEPVPLGWGQPGSRRWAEGLRDSLLFGWFFPEPTRL